MKKVLLILLSVLFCGTLNLNAQKKTITTTPSNAKIYIDGNYVADGSYTVKFKYNEDFINIKVEYPGYVTKEFRLYKKDARKTIGVALNEDDALENSIESENANQYFTIHVREDIDADKAWKLLTQVLLDYFNEIKTSDKSSGYMMTPWVTQQFPSAEVKVRTRVQIKETSIDGFAYQIKIFSEIADIDSGEQGFKPWSRVTKRFEPLINEMQIRIGKN